MSESELQAAALAPPSAKEFAMTLLQWMLGTRPHHRPRPKSAQQKPEHGPNEMQMHTFTLGGSGGPLELGPMGGGGRQHDREIHLPPQKQPNGSPTDKDQCQGGVEGAAPLHALGTPDDPSSTLTGGQEDAEPKDLREAAAAAEFCLSFMAHVLERERKEGEEGRCLPRWDSSLVGQTPSLALACSDGIAPR